MSRKVLVGCLFNVKIEYYGSINGADIFALIMSNKCANGTAQLFNAHVLEIVKKNQETGNIANRKREKKVWSY